MGKHSAPSGGFGLGPRAPKRARRVSVKPVEPRLEAVDDRPLPTPRRVGPAEEPAPPTRLKRERRSRILRGVLLGVLSAAIVLGVAGAAYGYFWSRSVTKNMTSETKVDPAIIPALTKSKPGEPFTVLLMGIDRRPGEPVFRCDTMIVARVDPGAKRVWLVSIPRDTRAEIPGKGVNKVNAASYGGYPLVIKTVEKLMDVKINHFAAVNFRGFQNIVDALGGVWIDVDVTIDDWRAATYSPGARAKHIDAGYQKLDGEHALTYVRSRDFPDADFTRMRHQQAFFRAVAKQSARFSNIIKMPRIVREFSKQISTDMSVGEIVSVATALYGIPDENLQTATLTGEWKSPYVYPDPVLLARLSKAISEGGDIEEKPKPKPQIKPSEVSVTVRNGSGYSGVAADVGGKLESSGYRVKDVGNAGQFVYDSTMIIYKIHETYARAVAADLGVTKIVESRGMYDFASDVLVIVGRDWERKAVMNRLTVPED